MSTRSGFDPNQKRASDGTWEKQLGSRPAAGSLLLASNTSDDTAYSRFGAIRDDIHERYARGEITTEERDQQWDQLVNTAPAALTELAREEHPDAERIQLELNITDEGSFLVPTEIITTSGEIITLDDDDDSPMNDVLFSVTSDDDDGTSIPGIQPRTIGTTYPDSSTYWVDRGTHDATIDSLTEGHLDELGDHDTYNNVIRPLSEQHGQREALAVATDDTHALHFLAHDHVTGVAVAAVHNPHTSPSTLHSVITNAALHRPDASVLAAAIRHPSVSAATLRHTWEHRSDNEWAAAAASAATTAANCPTDVLVAAWESNRDSVAAAHPNFPTDYLAEAIKHPTPTMVTSPNLRPEQLQQIADSTYDFPGDDPDDDAIRALTLAKVARHRAATRDLIEHLTHDRDQWVAKTATDRLRGMDREWEQDLLTPSE